MQKQRSNRQRVFLVSMTAWVLALGCAADDDTAPPGEGASGMVPVAAGKASALVTSGASAGGASASAEPSDGGMTSAGAFSQGGAGEGRVEEGGQNGLAGAPGARDSSGGEGGVGGQHDGGSASGDDMAGAAGGSVAGNGNLAGSGGGGYGGSGSSGGADSGGTLPCDVKAILKARCQSCHSEPPSKLAPMSLLTWSAVSMYADAIQEKLDLDLMPPPGAPDLSPDQQNALLVYVSLGAPAAGNVTCP